MKNVFQANLLHIKWGFFCLAIVLALAISFGLQTSRAQEADYRNPNLPLERRVADLLGRMTIEEKVEQMTTLWIRKPQQRAPNGNFGDRGDFSAEEAAKVMKHGIGEIAR